MARILVIDDDDMVRGVLREHLSNEGYQVETASRAEEGFNRAVQNPPDLIMLDVMMPDATGYQMGERLRGHPSTQSIPIIMMTGLARSANQQGFGKMMGANEYILKPFEVDDVSQKVRKLLGAKAPTAPEPAIAETRAPEQPMETGAPFQDTGASAIPEIILHEHAPGTSSPPPGMEPSILNVVPADRDAASPQEPLASEPEGAVEDRCMEFSIRLLEFISRLPDTLVGQKIADQLMQSGVMLGSNLYQDSTDTAAIMLRKIRETWYCLELIQKASIMKGSRLEQVRQECLELSALLAKATNQRSSTGT